MRSLVFWRAISTAAAQSSPRLEFELASVRPSSVGQAACGVAQGGCRADAAIAAGGPLQAGRALGASGGTGRPLVVGSDGPNMRGSVAVRFTVDQAHSVVHLDSHNMPMRELARALMRFDLGNGRPIVDMTGLEGSYDISLDIPMSMIGGPPPEAGAGHPADTVADPPENGRMMQSLKSLGLELKKMKAPVDHLVVDHGERKPTEN
ncbi:MAG TPA: TIGR03435 family protein [Bryobacteraceae bacterium]|nr:TIGR03435 family protein [Bryobacteraceae bacterium]